MYRFNKKHNIVFLIFLHLTLWINSLPQMVLTKRVVAS